MYDCKYDDNCRYKFTNSNCIGYDPTAELKANGLAISPGIGGSKDDRREHHKQTQRVFNMAVIKTTGRMVAAADSHSSFVPGSNSTYSEIAAKSVAR